MRISLAIGTVLLLSASHTVLAQEAPYSQTLSEQQAAPARMDSPVPQAKRVNEAMPAAGNPAAMVPMPRGKDGEVIDSLGGGAIPALVAQVQTANGITFITGGIGDEGLEAMKSQENNFNTRVLLATTGGEYLSGVLVRILDAQGNEMLAVDNAGPYFYVNLQPGSYEFEGTSKQGGIKKFKFTVPASGSVRHDLRFSA